MRPIFFFILFITSLALAAGSASTPWAEANFQIDDSDLTTLLTDAYIQSEVSGPVILLPISFWSSILWVDGCPRGSILRLATSLDLWVWTGRILFTFQACLWLAFIYEALRRKRLRWVAAGALVSLVLLALFLMLLNPIVECLYIVFPPRLNFTGEWHVAWPGILLATTATGCNLWNNAALRKNPR